MAFWNNPYPVVESDKDRLKNSLIAGVVVFLCLYLLQPFGFNRANSRLPIYLAYGAITFFLAFAYQFLMVRLFPNVIREENWTVGKEISHTAVLILLIAVGNYLFTVCMAGMSWNPFFLLRFVWHTFLIGIAPIGIGVILRQSHLLKKHQLEAASLNVEKLPQKVLDDNAESPDSETSVDVEEKTKELISIYDHQDRLQFTCAPRDFYFAKSADNYVECVYLVEGKMNRLLVRTTMQKLVDQVQDHPRLFRSHRSYLFNLGLLKEINGNSQGYQLELDGLEEMIPVSRARREALKKLLNN